MSDPQRLGEVDAMQAEMARIAAQCAAAPVESLEAREERWRREREEADETARREEAERMRQARTEAAEALRTDPSCRLPDAVITRIVERTLDATDALREVRTWLQSDAAFLVLLGATGLGKSVAAAWARTVVGGMSAQARDVADAYAYSHEGSRALRREYETARLLVVDEVGTERDADAAAAALIDVVDARQRGRLRTLITGNLTPRDFAARYGDRTLGRIRESGTVVALTGESLRGVR